MSEYDEVRAYTTRTHEIAVDVGTETWWLAVETPTRVDGLTYRHVDQQSVRLARQADDGSIVDVTRLLMTAAEGRGFAAAILQLANAVDPP